MLFLERAVGKNRYERQHRRPRQARKASLHDRSGRGAASRGGPLHGPRPDPSHHAA
jgi:hypothetical protein